MLREDRYFHPAHIKLAIELYDTIENLPLVCPHGHVDPRLFAYPNATFGTPTDLLLIPDHYIFRMLYSQGISLDALGIPRADGGPVETDHRKIWQLFADHFYLFRGTPTSAWLTYEMEILFGVQTKLRHDTAQEIYDQIEEKLLQPEFQPRTLFERFKIETLCTTDAATDTLAHHQAMRDSEWTGQVRPTFRPDDIINVGRPEWAQDIDILRKVSAIDVVNYRSFIQALEQRRTFFKFMGATATDHATLTATTTELTPMEAERIFQAALKSSVSEADAERFVAHMLMEMARMSVDDGLVMQLHIGAFRNHNRIIYERFGRDKGADIPISTEFTRNLLPLLDKFGNTPSFRIILFNLDESTYSRELAPLAGHYPAVLLGPPWWFHDSLNGMRRYFDEVMETAGLYNTAGFNDDTRAFPSIPARHDLWRRAASDWIAGLVARHIVDLDDGLQMVHAMAYDLAKHAYKL